MNLVNQLQNLYGWTPSFRQVFKKPVPPDLKTVEVPQTTGTSGWIVFTYENNIPNCFWISNQECKKLPCIADERICGGTFLRVERLSPLEFVVADIWLYNSNCVFACSTFSQRYDWLKLFLKTFTSHINNVTIKLIHKSDLKDVAIKGYELYEEEVGKSGYYVEKGNSETIHFVRMNMPDCYESVPFTGYLKVPDIKTSFYLREKGEEFDCNCIQVENNWVVVEKIPNLE